MKKNNVFFLMISCGALLVMPGCDWFNQKAENYSGEPVVRILDLNTDAVYKDAHIPGSIHLSLDEVPEIAQQWDKKTPIITYCSDYACMASHSAARTLKKLGFSEVYVFGGGIKEWYERSLTDSEKYPLEGKAQMAFLKKKMENPRKEEANTIRAEKVAQWLKKIR